jgi:hypothetical protein
MIMNTSRLLILMLFAFIEARAAETPLQHVLRVFTVPKADGLVLLAQDLDDRAMFQHLLDASKTSPEILEKLIVVTTGEDAEVKLLSAEELRYPSEFDPQQLPGTIAIGDTKFVALLQKLLEPEQAAPAPSATKPAAATPEKVNPRHPANGGLGIITSITPTAFEMRPLGDEIDLAIGGGRMIHLALTNTCLAGFQNFNGELQAQFSSREMVTAVSVVSGLPVFLGTLSAAQKTGGEFEKQTETVSLAFLATRSVAMPLSVDPASLAKDTTDVLARLEVVSIPKAEAAVLLNEVLDDNVLYSRLKQAVSAGSGKLEALLSGRARLDDESVLKECGEYRYPVAFDPPQVVRELVIADDQLLGDLRAGRQTGTGTPPSAANPHNGGFGLMTTATPTKFATNEVGTRLEIEIRRDEGVLQLIAKPQLSRLLCQRTYAGVQQPVFTAQSISTTRPARLGIPLFLGTLNRPLNTGLPESEKEDRVWFAFITLRE